jgi:competence protein ComGC
MSGKLRVRLKKFTLVEAMLTAAVIAIIAVLVIPFFSRANQKGRYTSWVNQKNLTLNDGELTVYYDFTDAEGSVVRNTARGVHQQDYDSINHDARLLGGNSWSRGRWQLKPALELDGSGAHISANSTFSKQSLTFIVWFKTSEVDGGLLMTCKKRALDSQSDLKLFFKKGLLSAVISKGVVNAKKAFEINKWHMATVTLGNKFKKLSLYLDGEPVGESDTFEMGTKAQGSFVLGFSPGAGFLTGKLGEFMSFSRELSAEEIQKIYNNSHP